MANVYIDVDFDEAFSGLSEREQQAFLDSWRIDYDYPAELTGLDDPAKLLRKRGYSVELNA